MIELGGISEELICGVLTMITNCIAGCGICPCGIIPLVGGACEWCCGLPYGIMEVVKEVIPLLGGS